MRVLFAVLLVPLFLALAGCGGGGGGYGGRHAFFGACDQGSVSADDCGRRDRDGFFDFRRDGGRDHPDRQFPPYAGKDN